MTATKIATCCYCGTRAALVFRGKERHELACSNCGAPLHELKMLRSDAVGERELVRPSPVRNHDGRRINRNTKTKSKRRRKKGLAYKVFEEAWDVLEDIFD